MVQSQFALDRFWASRVVDGCVGFDSGSGAEELAKKSKQPDTRLEPTQSWRDLGGRAATAVPASYVKLIVRFFATHSPLGPDSDGRLFESYFDRCGARTRAKRRF